MANVRTPKVHIPPCEKCDQPSMGAWCEEMEPVSAAGEPIMTVRFVCSDHSPGVSTIVLMSDRLYPAYRILYMFTESRMKVMRLSRAAQAERLTT